MKPSEHIVSGIAERECHRVARRVIRRLQNIGHGYMQSGDDSPLASVWDEVCVQVRRAFSHRREVNPERARHLEQRLLQVARACQRAASGVLAGEGQVTVDSAARAARHGDAAAVGARRGAARERGR